jgi:hypothetical protein
VPKGDRKNQNHHYIFSCSAFGGILGLSAAPVIADEVETELDYALGFMQGHLG